MPSIAFINQNQIGIQVKRKNDPGCLAGIQITQKRLKERWVVHFMDMNPIRILDFVGARPTLSKSR